MEDILKSKDYVSMHMYALVLDKDGVEYAMVRSKPVSHYKPTGAKARNRSTSKRLTTATTAKFASVANSR